MNNNTFIICDPQHLTGLGFSELIISSVDNSGVLFSFSKYDLEHKLEEHNDAIIIIDFELFDVKHLDEIALLSKKFPQTRWLFTSSDIDDDILHSLTQALSLANFVFKSDSKEDILTAIVATKQRKRYYCSAALDIILGYVPQKKKQEIFTFPLLTQTEREIVHLLVSGKTTKEIAETRCLSFHTVSTHRKNIFRKMKVNSIHDLIKSAIKCGLVDYTEYYI